MYIQPSIHTHAHTRTHTHTFIHTAAFSHRLPHIQWQKLDHFEVAFGDSSRHTNSGNGSANGKIE